MTEIQYLTIDHVIEFHDEALREFGGLDGIRSPHELAAAVMQPQQSAFGEDAYPTIPEKAAAYGFFIAEAQAFIDGNKRTAAMAMLAFLDLNGYELRQGDDEIAQMFEDIGSRVIGQGEFFAWVCSHARQLEGLEVHSVGRSEKRVSMDGRRRNRTPSDLRQRRSAGERIEDNRQ